METSIFKSKEKALGLIAGAIVEMYKEYVKGNINKETFIHIKLSYWMLCTKKEWSIVRSLANIPDVD